MGNDDNWDETLSPAEIKDRVRKIKELINGKNPNKPEPLIDLKEPETVISSPDLDNWKGIL